jgi:LssY C-terminus
MPQAGREFVFLFCSLLACAPALAQELPAGTMLEVRLSGATGSRISHRGDPIEATIIAPVSVEGHIVVPQGSKLLGSIANAVALGLGLKHSLASLAYAFHTVQLPSGVTLPVNTQLVEVETAKEGVDDLGTVHGIHPIMTLSSSLDFYAVPLLLIDPTIGAPVLCIKSVIAPSASPEIYFPAGTELILRLTTAVALPASNLDFPVSIESFSQGDLTDIEYLFQDSAARAHMGSRPSDVVNVLLLGSKGQMDRAFHASGWSQAQRKSPMSLFRMYHALTKRHGYPRAPMNALTLNGVPSAFVHQKSLDTVQKRHHVRLWQYPRKANVWLGAAAEDVGFRFESAHWTHSTNPAIDSERAKVVDDLAFTGCIDAAALLRRVSADLVQDPKTEHPIVTDGKVAVIRLNDCSHPKLMPGVIGTPALHPRRRVVRMLASCRDDLVRANIFFTTYNTVKFFAKHKSDSTTHVASVNGAPRGLDWLTPLAPPQDRMRAKLSGQ